MLCMMAWKGNSTRRRKLTLEGGWRGGEASGNPEYSFPFTESSQTVFCEKETAPQVTARRLYVPQAIHNYHPKPCLVSHRHIDSLHVSKALQFHAVIYQGHVVSVQSWSLFRIQRQRFSLCMVDQSTILPLISASALLQNVLSTYSSQSLLAPGHFQNTACDYK